MCECLAPSFGFSWSLQLSLVQSALSPPPPSTVWELSQIYGPHSMAPWAEACQELCSCCCTSQTMLCTYMKQYLHAGCLPVRCTRPGRPCSLL